MRKAEDEKMNESINSIFDDNSFTAEDMDWHIDWMKDTNTKVERPLRKRQREAIKQLIETAKKAVAQEILDGMYEGTINLEGLYVLDKSNYIKLRKKYLGGK